MHAWKSGRMGPKGKCPRGLDPRPKIPDSIATDDEDWEPPAWHAFCIGRLGPAGKCPRGLDLVPKIQDCIATDDEDWEPPAWYAWDEWDQKVNFQEIHLSSRQGKANLTIMIRFTRSPRRRRSHRNQQFYLLWTKIKLKVSFSS